MDSNVGIKEDGIKLESIRQARLNVMTTMTFLFRVNSLSIFVQFWLYEAKTKSESCANNLQSLLWKAIVPFSCTTFKYANVPNSVTAHGYKLDYFSALWLILLIDTYFDQFVCNNNND